VPFWGDTVHCHTVQLRRPSIAFAADSDEQAAIASRRKAFNLVSSNRWWVGAAHLPFPGVGHLRRNARPLRVGACHLCAGFLTDRIGQVTSGEAGMERSEYRDSAPWRR
jgi:hypothetical protein